MGKHPALHLVATRSTSHDHINLESCARHGVAVCIVPSYLLIDESQAMDGTKKSLADLATRTIAPELLAQTIVRRGLAWDTVVAVARETAADLIITTTHGYTGIKHVLMGSTAERIVRHAPCPVLVVREKKHEFV